MLDFLLGYWLGYEHGKKKDKAREDAAFWTAIAVCLAIIAFAAFFVAMTMDPIVMWAGIVLSVAAMAWAVTAWVVRSRRRPPGA